MISFIKSPITNHVFGYHMYRGIVQLGHSTIGLDLAKRTANIFNISIGIPYRRKGFGTTLLQYIEHDVISTYDIKSISLLAYQDPIERLDEFYQLNGYLESQEINLQKYDDGINVYDVITMHKIIK